MNRADSPYHSFQAAIAFVKRSGVRHIKQGITGFIEQGNYVRIVVGVDQQVTSFDGLSDLLDSLGDTGELWINHTERGMTVTFHPKLYLFEGEQSALLIIGSGNMTSGGLFTNDEAMSINELDLQKADDLIVLNEVKAALDQWCDPNLENTKRLDSTGLESLVDQGYVRTELTARTEAEGENEDRLDNTERPQSPVRELTLFGSGVSRRRPPRLLPSVSDVEEVDDVEIVVTDAVITNLVQELTDANWFAITVLQGDLPQRGSSPEIRIGKAIRDVAPDFWGWHQRDTLYEYDEEKGQYTRNISIRFNDEVLSAYLKDFPAKKPDGTKASADFRLGSVSPIVQSLREEDDMIVLELAEQDDVDYVAHIIYKADETEYESLANGLIQHTRSRSTLTGTYKKYKYVLND
jgi:HKD family nuclease